MAFRLLRLNLFPGSSRKKLPSALGKFYAVAHFEGVVIGDDDLGPIHIVEHVIGHQLTVFVITGRVIGLQHTETIFNRQAGATNEKSPREQFTPRAAHCIDGLPSDDHGHDCGFACASSQFKS